MSSFTGFNNGTLMGCGNNAYGQLGLGDKKNRYVLEEIKKIPKKII